MNVRLAGLAWFATLGMAAQAGTAPTAELPTAEPVLAVIYQEADSAADLSGIIHGIEEASDVVVYRVALKAEERLPEAASQTRRLAAAQPATPGSIAVLYPDIGEPYRGVFMRIIEGIEDKARTRVASYPVGAQQNAQELAAQLRRQNVRVVIALGRNGLKAASGLDRDIGVVVGGVLSVPEAELRGMAVHSLAPDPTRLFERLKSLAPGIRRVLMVYDPRQNGWLARLARDAAREMGLELVAREASDLKSAMVLYQEALANADPKRDALWLPQDSVTVDEASVLPMILKEAWERSLVVFSSSVAHVRRGALFSLYPDNMILGRNLADSALGRAQSGAGTAAIVPLKDVLVAVNVRTASHLGLGIGYRQQQAFDLVFPEQ